MVRTHRGVGAGGSISIGLGVRTLGSQDPKAPPRAGTRWRVGSQTPTWPLRARTQRRAGSWDLKWPLGAGTRPGVRGSGWAPGARTRKPPYLESSSGVWVLGPRTGYLSPLWHLRLLWFQPLRNQHHAHDFNCNRDLKH
jgi:hypothetical protein